MCGDRQCSFWGYQGFLEFFRFLIFSLSQVAAKIDLGHQVFEYYGFSWFFYSFFTVFLQFSGL